MENYRDDKLSQGGNEMLGHEGKIRGPGDRGVTITPEYLDDRVNFWYKINQCPGIEDEDGCSVVFYDLVGKLRILTEEMKEKSVFPSDSEEVHEIRVFYVPNKKISGILIFIIRHWPETGTEEQMYSFSGPYFKSGETLLTPEEAGYKILGEGTGMSYDQKRCRYCGSSNVSHSFFKVGSREEWNHILVCDNCHRGEKLGIKY